MSSLLRENKVLESEETCPEDLHVKASRLRQASQTPEADRAPRIRRPQVCLRFTLLMPVHDL